MSPSRALQPLCSRMHLRRPSSDHFYTAKSSTEPIRQMDSSSGGDDSTSHALGPQSSGCRFGPLDRSSVDRSFLGAAGVSQWPESTIVHVEGSRASEAPTKPPKFHEHSMRKLPRKEKKNRIWSKRRTRNARNVGLRPPPLEAPPSLLLTSWPSILSDGFPPFGPPPFGAPPFETSHERCLLDNTKTCLPVCQLETIDVKVRWIWKNLNLFRKRLDIPSHLLHLLAQ